MLKGHFHIFAMPVDERFEIQIGMNLHKFKLNFNG